MIEFKDKELENWWRNDNSDKGRFRNIRLTKYYFLRDDSYNISEKDVAEIKRKEEDKNRQKLMPIVKKFIKSHSHEIYIISEVDVNFDYGNNVLMYLSNLILDFREKTTSKKKI